MVLECFLGEFSSLSPATMILQITLLTNFCGFYTLEFLSKKHHGDMNLRKHLPSPNILKRLWGLRLLTLTKKDIAMKKNE